MSHLNITILAGAVLSILVNGCGQQLPPPGPDGKPVKTWRQVEREQKQRFAWARRESTDSASYFLRNEKEGKPNIVITYYLGERDGKKDVVIAHSLREVPKGNFEGIVHWEPYQSFAPLRARLDKDTARSIFANHSAIPIDSMALVLYVPDWAYGYGVAWYIWTAHGGWYLFIDSGSVVPLEELIKSKEENERLWNSAGKRR